ncbi:MAG: DUF4358 domain-containing protein [Oscillospiraceae bacterium]|nr:DUF4358 domain-containing protein [Oscillospiraceae bacterium]
MIKKIVAFAVIAALTFTLVSCRSSFSLDTSKLAEDIRNADLFLDTLAPVSESVVKKVVGLSTDLIDDFIYEIGTGATGEEFAVITCKSESDAKKVKDEIVKRQDSLYNTYESYSPESLPRISNAVIEQKGVYVIFVSCDKDPDAQKLVDSYLK